jgi:hypothetical protein
MDASISECKSSCLSRHTRVHGGITYHHKGLKLSQKSISDVHTVHGQADGALAAD